MNDLVYFVKWMWKYPKKVLYPAGVFLCLNLAVVFLVAIVGWRSGYSQYFMFTVKLFPSVLLLFFPLVFISVFYFVYTVFMHEGEQYRLLRSIEKLKEEKRDLESTVKGLKRENGEMKDEAAQTLKKFYKVYQEKVTEAKVSSDEKAVAVKVLEGEKMKVELLLRKNEELDEEVEFLNRQDLAFRVKKEKELKMREDQVDLDEEPVLERED